MVDPYQIAPEHVSSSLLTMACVLVTLVDVCKCPMDVSRRYWPVTTKQVPSSRAPSEARNLVSQHPTWSNGSRCTNERHRPSLPGKYAIVSWPKTSAIQRTSPAYVEKKEREKNRLWTDCRSRLSIECWEISARSPSMLSQHMKLTILWIVNCVSCIAKHGHRRPRRSTPIIRACNHPRPLIRPVEIPIRNTSSQRQTGLLAIIKIWEVGKHQRNKPIGTAKRSAALFSYWKRLVQLKECECQLTSRVCLATLWFQAMPVTDVVFSK